MNQEAGQKRDCGTDIVNERKRRYVREKSVHENEKPFSREESSVNEGLIGDIFESDGTPENVITTYLNDSNNYIDEIVCFGMLFEITVRLNPFPNESIEESTARLRPIRNGTAFLHALVSLGDNIAVLETENREIIALFSTHVHDTLSKLPNIASIRMDGLVSEAEWRTKVGARHKLRPKDAKGVSMKTNVLLFGPRSSSEGVAKCLASHQLYLQDPYEGLISYPYENPQSLQFPDIKTPEAESSDLISLLCQESDTKEEPVLESQEPEDWDLFADIDGFLDRITEHSFITEAPTDIRIITPLLSHQLQGVKFISLREDASSMSEHSLWQYSTTNEETYYQHVITGAKSQVREDVLGGILADDMGLGKTLIILAAIVGSLNTSVDFARSGNLQTPTGNINAFAKSSLVVVPSELLLETWVTEIHKHICCGAVRFMKYHGAGRHLDEVILYDQDIILTTYGTVVADFRRQNGILFQTQWYRLILDEAHSIRNCGSKQFQAVTKISSHIKWCLTGTPIQNSLDDLGALIKFMRLPILDNTATFRKYISKRYSQKGKWKIDFENLRLLLSAVCLRRSRSMLKCSGYKEMNENELDAGCSSEKKCCRLCHKKHSAECLVLGHTSSGGSGRDKRPVCIPSKIGILLKDVQTNYQQGKCIIFSFWKKTLDILAAVFDTSGIEYLRLDGSLTAKKRDEILLKFQREVTSRVLIMTFSTGSVGLNGLTVASRVHILEPQWNPAVENQAIGRVLRIDQGQQVTVLRYAMRDSIELMVQSRQHHKLKLASGGFMIDGENVVENSI